MKPEVPNALQVKVPSKKAETIPERESPATRRGEPIAKMRRLLRSEDSHVGGDMRITSISWNTDMEIGDDLGDGNLKFLAVMVIGRVFVRVVELGTRNRWTR